MPKFVNTIDMENNDIVDVKQLNFNATSGTPVDGVIDDDTFATASATTLATSESIKAYIDARDAGLDPKESVRFATLDDIAGTYASGGGAGGTGAFTAVDLTDGALFDLNGETVAVNDRIILKDQTDPLENGIYRVTTAGATGVIERAPDQDGTPAEEVSSGNYTFVEVGATYAGTGFVALGDGILTLNTDPINWTMFSQATALTPGDGIEVTANVVSVDTLASGGLKFVSGELAVEPADIAGTGLEDDGSDSLRIATAAAGNGLTGGGGSALAVQPDAVGGANIARAISVGVNGVGVDVDDTTITENGSGQLSVVTTGTTHVARVYTETLGGSADTFVVTHNLGAAEVTVNVLDISGGAGSFEQVYPTITTISTTQCTVEFGATVTGSNYQVVVIG